MMQDTNLNQPQFDQERAEWVRPTMTRMLTGAAEGAVGPTPEFVDNIS